MDQGGDLVRVAIHHQHVGVALDAHRRQVEGIGAHPGRFERVAIAVGRDQNALPLRALVHEITPHVEVRHVLELGDIDLGRIRRRGGPISTL
jgi:hypothetical protein